MANNEPKKGPGMKPITNITQLSGLGSGAVTETGNKPDYKAAIRALQNSEKTDHSTWRVVGEGIFGANGEDSTSLMASMLSQGDRDKTYDMLSGLNPTDPGAAAARQAYMQHVDYERETEANAKALQEAAREVPQFDAARVKASAPSAVTAEADRKIRQIELQMRQAGRTGLGSTAELKAQLAQAQKERQAALDAYAAQIREEYRQANRERSRAAGERKSEQIGLLDLQEADAQTNRDNRAALARALAQNDSHAQLEQALYAAQGANDQAEVERIQRELTRLDNPTAPVTIEDLQAERDRLQRAYNEAGMRAYAGGGRGETPAQMQEIRDAMDKIDARIEAKQLAQSTGTADRALETEIQTYHDFETLDVEALVNQIGVYDSLIEFARSRQSEALNDPAVRTGLRDKAETTWKKWIDEEARLRALRDEAQEKLDAKQRYDRSLSDNDRRMLQQIEDAKQNLDRTSATAQAYADTLREKQEDYQEARRAYREERANADAYAWKSGQYYAAVKAYNYALQSGADPEDLDVIEQKAEALAFETDAAYQTMYEPYAQGAASAALNQAAKEVNVAAYKYSLTAQRVEDRVGAYYKAYDALAADRASLPKEYYTAYENVVGLTALIDGYHEKLDALYEEENALLAQGQSGSLRAQEIDGLIGEYNRKITDWMLERAQYYSYAYTYDYTRTMAELPAEDRKKFEAILTGNTKDRDALLEKYGQTKYERTLEMVQRAYNEEQRKKQQAKIQNLSGLEAVNASIASVASNLLSAPGVLYEIIRQGAGNYGSIETYTAFHPYDTNAAGFAAQNFTRDVRGVIGARIEQDMLAAGSSAEQAHWGSIAYATVLSGLDSLLAMGIGSAGHAMGISAELGGHLLGVTAAANSMQDIAERGGNLGEILAGGTIAGIFEGLFENWSIENFRALTQKEIVHNVGEMLENIGKSMLTNFSEEANTEVANIAYDVVTGMLGMPSEWKDRFDELKRQESLTDSQAFKAVAAEIGVQILEAGASGALMGLGFGMLGSVENRLKGYMQDIVEGGVRRGIALRFDRVADRNANLLPEYQVDLTYTAGTTTAADVREMAQQVYNAEVKQNAARKAAEQAHPEETERVQAKAQELAEVRVRTTATAAEISAQAEAGAQAGEADAEIAREGTEIARESARIAENAISRETTVNTARAETEQAEAAGRGGDAENAYAREEARQIVDELAEQYADMDMLAYAVNDRADVFERQEGWPEMAQALRQELAERQAGSAPAETPSVASGNVMESAQAQAGQIVNRILAETEGNDAQVREAIYAEAENQRAAGNDAVADGIINQYETMWAEQQEEDAKNGVYSDRGGERDAGTDPAEGRAELGESAEGTRGAAEADDGRREGGNGQAERAAARVIEAQKNKAPKIFMREISTQGRADAQVTDITASTQDPELAALKKRADADGVKVRFVLGGMKFVGLERDSAGHSEGYTITVRVDHPRFTATQLYDHEWFHVLKQDHPGLVSRVFDAVQSKYLSFGMDMQEMYDAYADAYEGAFRDLDAEERDARIREEICADCYAGRGFGDWGQEEMRSTAQAAAREVTGESYRDVRPEATQTQQETRAGSESLALDEVSDSEKTKITSGMSDQEREDILRQKAVFHAPTYDGQAEAAINARSENLNSGKISLIQKAVRQAAAELNMPTELFNKDMDLVAYISNGSLDESTKKQIDNAEQLVRLIPVLQDAVQNAVGIEVHDNRYFADFQTLYFANLLGGYVDGDDFVPVRFGIKASRDGHNTLYVVISDQKIKEAEVVGPSNPDNSGHGGSRSASAINIASLAKNVKHADILKYLPDGMLTEEQRELKWKAIADTVVYTNDKNDRKYNAFLEKGDKANLSAMVQAAAKAAGYTVHAYHGTGRADRVGNVFRPDRATSGPMAFFTDSREIAENYSRDKRDTSIAYDTDYDSYETQFRARHAKTGKDFAIYKLWGYIPMSERAKIAERAKHVRIDFDGDGEIIYDPQAQNANGGWEYQVKEFRGDILKALNEQWLNSGNLFDQEGDYLKVLEMVGVNDVLRKAGFEMPRYMDPEYREEKVYDTYLRIQNPFDAVNMIDEDFISGFEEFADENEDRFTKESAGADYWDKNNVTAEEFVERMRSDLENGVTHAWTSIPDVMTEYLKSLRYDGIKDSGGKNGGVEHTVWVPFESEQVKSADPVTYDNDGNVIPLSERFNTEKEDIRFALDDAPDSETRTGELEQEIEAGDPGDDEAQEPTIDEKINAAAAYIELDDWAQKAYDDALAKGDTKTADLIQKQRAASRMAKDLRRQANREKAAFKKDGDEAHVQRMNELRRQANEYAKREREYAKQTNVKTAPSPVQTIRRTADSLLKMWHVAPAQQYSYRQQLQGVLEGIYRKGYVGDNDVSALFRAMFDDAVDTVNPDPAYEQVAEMMRDRHIYVSDQVRAEFGDDWESFRRAMWGARMIASSNTADRELDSYYQELAAQNPGIFDPEVADGAVQLQAIYDAVKQGRPKEVPLREAYQMQGLDDEAVFENMYTTAEGILQQFANTADLESRLTRDAEETESNLRGQLREERAAHRERLEQARAAFAEQQRRRQRTEKMNQIRSSLKMLRRMSRENNANFIRAMSEQDEMTQKYMKAALESINTVANSMTNRTLNNIKDLKAWYQEYKADNPNFISLPGVENAINRLDEVNLSDISVEELEILYNVIQRVNHALQSANNLIEEGREISLAEAGDAMRRETDEARGKTKIPILRNFLWNEDALSLSRGLKRLGGYNPNSQMWKIAEAFERGDMDAMAYQEGADMVLQPFLARRNNDARRKWLYTAAGEFAEFAEVEVPRILGWDQGDAPISDENGPATIRLKLTQMQLVQMYLDLRNEDNLRHVKYGGYTMPDADLYKKGELAEANAKNTTVKMGPDVIRRIVNENLKPEGKEFAELLDKYYNVYSKQHMNRVSRRLDGVDKAIGNHYYPIRTSGTERASAFNFFDGTIAGMGLLKTRQMYAANPILLQDADRTYQWHRDMMARYVGYAIPTRDFKALLGYKADGTGEVNQTQLTRKFGAGAKNWLEDFFKVVETGDLEESKGLNKIVGNYINQVLSANISSMLKQFAALALAGSSYGQGSILRGIANLKAQTKTDPAIIRLYTPYLDMRNQELLYDQVTEIVRDKAGSVGQIALATALGRNWMNATDYWANRMMWAAAEDVVRRQNPNLRPGTEAEIKAGKDLYYKEVARVFNRITFDTQTNSNMMSKPNILRRKDSGIKAWTMFRTDAYQMAGIFREALGQAQWAEAHGTDTEKSAAKRKMINAIVGTLTSSMTSAAMGILANILRRRDKDLRDEEGNIDWKKIGTKFAVDSFESLTSCVLAGSEIFSFLAAQFVEGADWYDITSAPLDAVNDLLNTVQTQSKKIFQALRVFAESDAQYRAANADDLLAPVWKLGKAAAQFFGLPAANIEKNILAVLGWIWPEAAVAVQDVYTEYAKKDLEGKTGAELRATLQAYLSDEVGELSDAAIDEYMRLYELMGPAVLPNANTPGVIKSEDEEGNVMEREVLSRDAGIWDSTYRETMIELINSMVDSDAYKALTDDEKKKMLAKVASYSAEAGKLAIGADAADWAEDIRAAVDEGADLDDALLYYTQESWITADRDEEGKEIRSAESKRMELLASMDLTDAERGILLKAFKKESKTWDALKDELANGDLWTVAKIMGENAKTADQLKAIIDADMDDEDKRTVYNILLSDGADKALQEALDRDVSLDRFADLYALGGAAKVNSYTKMLDAGTDADLAYKILNTCADIKPEKEGGSVTDMQKIQAIAASGEFGPAEKWDAISAIGDSEKGREKLYAIRDAGANVNQYIDMRTAGDSVVNAYLDATRLGMTSNAAYKAVMAVKDLPEPPEGQEYGTTDRQKAAVRACDNVDDQILAYAAFSAKDDEESMMRKLYAAKEYDVSPAIYMDFLDTRKKYDADENGSYNQKEIKAALDSMDLTKDQKAVLWQMCGNWAAKNNPYSSAIGTAYNTAKNTRAAESDTVSRSMPGMTDERANEYAGGNRPNSRRSIQITGSADVYRRGYKTPGTAYANGSEMIPLTGAEDVDIPEPKELTALDGTTNLSDKARAEYEALKNEGMHYDGALRVVRGLEAREEMAGETDAQSKQRQAINIIANASRSAVNWDVERSHMIDNELVAIRHYSEHPDADYARFQAALDYGVDPALFVEISGDIMEEYDPDEGRVTQNQVKAYLDSYLPDYYTQEQKAAIWQLMNETWNAKDNPYATYVGEQIKDAYDANR